MSIYIVIWFLLFLPAILRGNRNVKGYNQYNSAFVFFCLLVLIGFRHITVGADTSAYEAIYYLSSERVQSAQSELGYYHFSNFFNQLGVPFVAFNFIVSLILVFTLIEFYSRYSRNLSFSVLIFMTIGLLSMYMSGTRQSLAISLSLIAVQWADKHKGLFHSIVAFFLVWLASTFHASAVACFPAVAFIMFRARFSRPFLFVLVAVVSAALLYRNYLVILIQLFLPNKYTSYNLNANYQINPLLIIISILIPIFCLFFDSDVDDDGKYNCEKTWMYVFSCCNILFTILAKNSMYFSRIAFYFLHFNSLIIPNVISSQRLRRNARFMYLFIGIICMLYFLISIPGGVLKIDNYKFFWQD